MPDRYEITPEDRLAPRTALARLRRNIYYTLSSPLKKKSPSIFAFSSLSLP